MGESAGEGLWLLALVTGGIWHVTCHTWHVTRDTWHMIFFKQKVPKSARKVTKKCQKVQKMAKKCPKVQKSVKKAGFHSIGATIHTRWESLCLPHADFFLYPHKIHIIQWYLCHIKVLISTTYVGFNKPCVQKHFCSVVF